MYILALVMLSRALAEAVLMQVQTGSRAGRRFLSPEHFAQLFGTTARSWSFHGHAVSRA
jgi:cytochrome o ubiquinol oxidase subunit 1